MQERAANREEQFYRTFMQDNPSIQEYIAHLFANDMEPNQADASSCWGKAPNVPIQIIEDVLFWARNNSAFFQRPSSEGLAAPKREPNGKAVPSEKLVPINNYEDKTVRLPPILGTRSTIPGTILGDKKPPQVGIIEDKKKTIIEDKKLDLDAPARSRGRPMQTGIHQLIGSHKEHIPDSIKSSARDCYFELVKGGVAQANWCRIKVKNARCSCKRCKADKAFNHGLRFLLVFKDKETNKRREKSISKA